MGTNKSIAVAAVLAGILMGGCGSGGGATAPVPPTTPTVAAPAVATSTTNGAQGGAVIVSLSSTSAGATIYYTIDGTTPTTASQQYQAPFLVAANLTVKAIAAATGSTTSSVTSQSFTPNIASGTLVWSDEFQNTTGANQQPNPQIWGYETGDGGFGNSELEDYYAWGSASAPCSAASPSAYVAPGGGLHIVAQQTTPGSYTVGSFTSARLKTQGLFSFQYGRIEFKAQVPEAQGFWPAAWLLGNNIATVNWPTCGEMDVLERVNAASSSPAGQGAMLPAGSPDWNEGSIHGTGFTGGNLGTVFNFPTGQNAASWHTYGMIWKPGSVAYYVDNPSAPYVTYTTASSLSALSGAAWPFDAGQSSFILLNLAVGGEWPGSPNASTPFPSQMLVDYVRVYTN